jgi:hypothetical protein
MLLVVQMMWEILAFECDGLRKSKLKPREVEGLAKLFQYQGSLLGLDFLLPIRGSFY